MIDSQTPFDQTFAESLRENRLKIKLFSSRISEIRTKKVQHAILDIKHRLLYSFNTIVIRENLSDVFGYYQVHSDDYTYIYYFQTLIEEFSKANFNFKSILVCFFAKIFNASAAFIFKELESEKVSQSVKEDSNLSLFKIGLMIDAQSIADFDVVSSSKQAAKNHISFCIVSKLSRFLSDNLVYEIHRKSSLCNQFKDRTADQICRLISNNTEVKESNIEVLATNRQVVTFVSSESEISFNECFDDLKDIAFFQQAQELITIKSDTFTNDCFEIDLEEIKLEYQRNWLISKTVDQYLGRKKKRLIVKLTCDKKINKVVITLAKTLFYKFVIEIKASPAIKSQRSYKNLALLAFLSSYFYQVFSFFSEEADVMARDYFQSEFELISNVSQGISGHLNNIIPQVKDKRKVDRIKEIDDQRINENKIFKVTDHSSNEKRVKQITTKLSTSVSNVDAIVGESSDLRLPENRSKDEYPSHEIFESSSLGAFLRLQAKLKAEVIRMESYNLEHLKHIQPVLFDMSALPTNASNIWIILQSNIERVFGAIFQVKICQFKDIYEINYSFGLRQKAKLVLEPITLGSFITFTIASQNLKNALDLSLFYVFEQFFPGDFDLFARINISSL